MEIIFSDAPYLAGFIDGEGTITANFRMSARSRREAVHYRVMISNSDLTIMEWIQARWGGKLERYGKPRSPKHKQMHYIYWGGPDCIPVIQAVYPYLIIKRRQAQLVLALHALRIDRPQRRAGVPEELHGQRRDLVAQVVKLNYRGIPQEALN